VTGERWARVKSLFQAVVERPLAERDTFLAAMTAGDDELRHEVESLLASDAAHASVLDRLPVAAAPGLGATPVLVPEWTSQTRAQPVFGARDRVGVYEIVAPLGAGGMGEVYRGRDTTLNRDVALKVLPAAFSLDPDRLARFRREARMLAALNHPNIAAIYGFEESIAARALVLELVEGPTLADWIAKGPMPPEQALPIARQIAEALEAAHEQGIIHRDLKPANVKVRPDGVVKVLDFGLAKALASEPAPAAVDPAHSPTISNTATREGLILGTAAYMSPEQARGQLVDKRTDIWAFGCVIFEMLVGKAAFRGDTATDLLAAVVKDEPCWTDLPAETPTAIRRLLVRCLKKDPRQRLQAIGDARIEIDTIDETLPAVSEATASRRGRPRWQTAWLPWAAAAALAVGVGIWEARRAVRRGDSDFAAAQFTRLTDWQGTQGRGEISPDGKFVAFLSDRAGEFDIWWSQVGTGRFTNLTPDIPALDGPRTDSLLRTFGFSGDGAEIWFSLGDASAPKLIRALSGGTPRAFLSEGTSTPSWSPDGSRLVYFANRDGDPLFIADSTGGDAREIPIAPSDPADWSGDRTNTVHNHNPVWSPDGEWIYFSHGLDPTVRMDIWRVRPSGGAPERITNENAAVTFLTPLDARTLLFVGRLSDRQGPWLWALDVENKVTRRLSWGLEQYTTVAASRDGRRVVATIANPTVTLWRVPLLDRPAEDRDAQPYAVPTTRALAPRFGGTSLFYLSARGTGDGLWRVQDGQAYEIRTSADGPLSEPPAVTLDGSRVAVTVRQQGKRHLAIMSADGTNARTFAASIDVDGAAGQAMIDWSPDGRWIVTGGSDAQGPALLKVPIDGGAPIRLVAGQAANPVWSPDGSVIVYSGTLGAGANTPLLGVRPSGEPVELPQVRVRPGGYRFLPDGKRLVYLPRLQALDFWQLDFTTNLTRQITRLGNRGALRTFDITPDGKSLVFDRSQQNSELVVIDLPEPTR